MVYLSELQLLGNIHGNVNAMYAYAMADSIDELKSFLASISGLKKWIIQKSEVPLATIPESFFPLATKKVQKVDSIFLFSKRFEGRLKHNGKQI